MSYWPASGVLVMLMSPLLPAYALAPTPMISHAGRHTSPIAMWSPAASTAKSASHRSLARVHAARRRPEFAMSVSGSSSPGDLIKQGAQIGTGAGAIFALERSLWALSKAADVWIPTAPAGMILVFMILLAIHAASPKMAGQIKEWFGPTLTFYSKGVPLFFSPPLVQLPLSLGILPLMTILKYIMLVTTGTVLSVIATGLAANALVSAPSVQSPSMNNTPVGTTTVSKSPVAPRTSPVLKAAVAGMAIFAGEFSRKLDACTGVLAGMSSDSPVLPQCSASTRCSLPQQVSLPSSSAKPSPPASVQFVRQSSPVGLSPLPP